MFFESLAPTDVRQIVRYTLTLALFTKPRNMLYGIYFCFPGETSVSVVNLHRNKYLVVRVSASSVRLTLDLIVCCDPMGNITYGETSSPKQPSDLYGIS